MDEQILMSEFFTKFMKAIAKLKAKRFIFVLEWCEKLEGEVCDVYIFIIDEFGATILMNDPKDQMSN